MKTFLCTLKKRVFRKYTVFGIIIAMLLIALTFYIRGYEDIQYYNNIVNGEYEFLISSSEEKVLNKESIKRANDSRLAMEESYIYSFDSVINRALYSYDFFAPILLTLPVLSFFYERKKGYLKYSCIRVGHYRRYIFNEGVSCAITGWLITVIPCIIAWLFMFIFCPSLYNLNQALIPNTQSVLGFLYQENTLAYAYLLHMLIYSVTFFFLTLLTFAFSLIVKHGAYLIFIPLLYTKITFSFLSKFSLGLYSPSFIIGELNMTLSYSPILMTCFYTFLLSYLIIIFARRESVFSG